MVKPQLSIVQDLAIPQYLATNEEISKAMNDLGLFSLSRPRRDAVAQQLVTAGFTVEDIHTLWEEAIQHCRSSKDARALVASIVSDPQRLQEVLDDLRAFQRAEQNRQKQNVVMAPGEHDRKINMQTLHAQRSEWQAADREHYVRCRMADGVSKHDAEVEYDRESKLA